MKHLAMVLALGAVLASFGCKKDEGGSDAKGAQEPAQTGANSPAGGVQSPGNPSGTGGSGSGSSVNITPMGGVGAGPMTPVAGAEGIQGGGSAAGQVMKDKARNLAAQPPSSLNQAGGDD